MLDSMVTHLRCYLEMFRKRTGKSVLPGRLIGLCVAAGFFWLLILLTLTMSDYLTRSWLVVTGW